MSRVFRSPAAVLTALYTGSIALLFLLNPRPAFFNAPPEFGVDEAKPFRESVEMLRYHYEQRAYGNPGVNIDQRLWDAWQDVAQSPQSALLKPFSTAATWKSEGPTNIGGRMRAVAFHPVETNTIYAGGASGGVWRSTDLGESWTPLTDDQPRMTVGALAIDENNPSTIFAGTGEPVAQYYPRYSGAPTYDGVGVLRSDDGGDNWELLPWPATSSAVHRIALHPESSDTLLVATTNKLYKSTDGGQNWSSTLSGVITDVLYKPDDPSTVYAAVGNDFGSSSNGVYVSHAGGGSWTWEKLETNFAPGDSLGRIVLSIPKSDPDRIYAGAALSRRRMPEGDIDFKGVFISYDAGQTWERKQTAINNGFTRGQAFYDLCIATSPTDPDFVMMGGIDLYRSTNGGDGFSKLTRWELRTIDPDNPAYVHADQHHLAFKPDDPSVIVSANDGGIFISTTSGSGWKDKSEGLVTTQFYSITYAPSNSDLLYGGTQDNSNMRQASPGLTNWSYVGGGDGGRIAVDPDNSSLMYFTINTTPYRTFDGTSLQRVGNGLSGYRVNWVRPLLLDPSGERLYTGSHYMHRLSPAKDAGSWLTISQSALTNTSVVTDLAMPPENPRYMYATTGDGKVYYCFNVLALDPEWINMSEGLPNRWITDINILPGTWNTVYISMSGYGTGHAFKTTDGGESWEDISGDLPDIPANAIIPDPDDPNTIFLATDVNVWYTTNGGENWKQFGNGLPNVVCYDMKLTPENKLVVGTYGRGIWTVDAVTSVGEPEAAPSGIALAANYPNPFGSGAASSTTLRYSLDRADDVQLQVYDASGRMIATLVEGRREAGSHTAAFAASNLPAGTYFAVLRAGSQTLTRKMVLMR